MKCKHENTKSHWQYKGTLIEKASGFCEDCNATFIWNGLQINSKLVNFKERLTAPQEQDPKHPEKESE